ncbi:MAG: Uncharacterised protein [Oceanospirillaceae bacterium UBA2001]|nr:MAG: Uncharacterised protein [Oceanospirillaceae bacterium UBA2001]
MRLLPGILLYLIYLSVLTSLRDEMTKAIVNADLKIWLLHGFFLLLGLILLFAPHGFRQWSRRGNINAPA